MKRAHATIDAVIVAAEKGHGRRAGVLSDYTFAVWRECADASGEELVAIGKAYSGLTDDEIDAMTEAARRHHGGAASAACRVVRPEIVLEVAFDGLQRSSRHASGFALRFPRIVRVRDDKRPEEADRLAAVEAIFTAQVAPGSPRAGSRAAAARGAGGRRTRPGHQLSLFGSDDEP